MCEMTGVTLAGLSLHRIWRKGSWRDFACGWCLLASLPSLQAVGGTGRNVGVARLKEPD